MRLALLVGHGWIGSKQRNVTTLNLYGSSKVNAGARGHTRDLRVLWALQEMQLPFELAGMDHPAHDLNTEVASYRDRCLARPAWQRTIEAYCARVEAA